MNKRISKTWGRHQIRHLLPLPDLVVLGETTNTARTELSRKTPDAPFWPAERKIARFVLSADAGVDHDTKPLAPDIYKETYFKQLAQVEEKEEVRNLAETGKAIATIMKEQEATVKIALQDSLKPILIWILYTTGQALIPVQPLTAQYLDAGKQPRWILSGFQKRTKSPLLTMMTTMYLPICLPKQRSKVFITSQPRICIGIGSIIGITTGAVKSRRSPTSSTEWGLVIELPSATNVNFSVETMCGKITTHSEQYIEEHVLKPEELRSYLNNPNPATSQAIWDLEINNCNWQSLRSSIPEDLNLEDFLVPDAGGLSWCDPHCPKQRMERQPAAIELSENPFFLAHSPNDPSCLPSNIKDPPPTPNLEENAANSKLQKQWCATERTTRDDLSWTIWLSGIGLTKEDIDNYLTITPFNPLNRKVYMITRAITEGLSASSGVMWEATKSPLACCCMTCNVVNVTSNASNAGKTSTKPCTNITNPIGLQGTHDPTRWRDVVRSFEAQNLDTKTLTTNIHYCLCGFSSQSKRKRDHHSRTASNDKVHGAFFDELPWSGGSVILTDLQQNEVIFAAAFKIPIQTTKRMDSTLGEGEATIEGLVLSALTFLPPVLSETDPIETILIVTDSHALYDVYQNYVRQTPTVSEELKTPMGGTAATLRNIIQHLQEKLKLKIIIEWQSNYHDEPYDSDNFLDFKKQFNNIVDIGATLGRDVIFQDPPPATPITNDYGSSADARAIPARPGHGHPLVLTMQHLKCSDITKEDVANIQSARNLNYLQRVITPSEQQPVTSLPVGLTQYSLMV